MDEPDELAPVGRDEVGAVDRDKPEQPAEAERLREAGADLRLDPVIGQSPEPIANVAGKRQCMWPGITADGQPCHCDAVVVVNDAAYRNWFLAKQCGLGVRVLQQPVL